jgi:predicted Zn-dependent protease
MKTLPHPDNFHLEAAQGWLMLGDPAAAKEELAKLRPASRAKPEVLEFEWSVHAAASSWARAHEVAQQLVAAAPQRPFGWIHRAYAARRMPGGGLPCAWEALRPAADKFPKEFLIPYNLACYAAQMGRPDEAWDWLQEAVAAAGNADRIKKMALADADLEPLWPRLAQ